MLHRAGRVLSFFSSRRNWDSPNPSPAGERAPPYLVRGGGAHSLTREWESPNSDEGTYTVVLYVLCAVLPTFMYRKKALTKKSFCWSSEAWLLQPGSRHLHQQQAGEDHGSVLFSIALKPVLRIHDILVWIRIRIRGSMPLN
jgi:hypothetical protein